MKYPHSSVCNAPFLPELYAFIESRAKQGDGLAKWKLAMAAMDGRLDSASYPKALEHLKEARRAGIATAAFYMSEILRESLTGESYTHEDIRTLLAEGAKAGHARAQMARGLMLLRCPRQALDEAVAYHYLRLAAWNGLSEAGFYLLYLREIGGAPGLSKGEVLLYLDVLAAPANYHADWVRLNYRMTMGAGLVDPDHYEKLRKTYAEAGVKSAIYSIIHGQLAYEPDYAVVEDRFMELLEAGEPEALYFQGRRLLSFRANEAATCQLGIDSLQRARALGYWPADLELAGYYSSRGEWAKALALLDGLWYLGLVEGVASLRSQIASQMLEANKTWDPALVARIEASALFDQDSLWTLARLCSGQVGFPRQKEEHFFYLVLAAQEGCVIAVRILALELMDLSIRDYEALALRLLECAALHEDVLACALLGDCYAVRKHRIPNPRVSYRWYLKGAKLGYDYCMERVIRCQQLGLGVEPDESVLQYWSEALAQKKKTRGPSAGCSDSQKTNREHHAQIIPFAKTRG